MFPVMREDDYAQDDISDQLWTITQALGPLYDLLVQHEFTTSQRRSLSTYLHDQAPNCVKAIATALEERPDLFQGAPVDPRRLKVGQRNADALRDMCGHLFILHRLCMDTFMHAQVSALQEAYVVPKWVAAQAQFLTSRTIDQMHLERVVTLSMLEEYLPRKGRKPKKAPRGRPKVRKAR